MRTRVIALSALTVMVALGVLGMHALGIGHAAKSSMGGMAPEHVAQVSTMSAGAFPAPDSTGDGHTNALSTLCVAILSAGLALAVSALVMRALARERRAQPPSQSWIRLATRIFVGRPPPLLTPLRT